MNDFRVFTHTRYILDHFLISDFDFRSLFLNDLYHDPNPVAWWPFEIIILQNDETRGLIQSFVTRNRPICWSINCLSSASFARSPRTSRTICDSRAWLSWLSKQETSEAYLVGLFEDNNLFIYASDLLTPDAVCNWNDTTNIASDLSAFNNKSLSANQCLTAWEHVSSEHRSEIMV